MANEFEALCDLLPADVNWGDRLTPAIVAEIAMAVETREREAIIERLQAHLTEPQVMVVTRLTDSPRKVAINECIGIVKVRSNVKSGAYWSENYPTNGCIKKQ